MARLRHCILKPMPASHDHERDHDHERGHREELLLDMDPPAALWVLLGAQCLAGRWSVSNGNFGLLGMSGEGCGGRSGEGGIRCILVLLYEWVGSSES